MSNSQKKSLFAFLFFSKHFVNQAVLYRVLCAHKVVAVGIGFAASYGFKERLFEMGRLYECFETPTELDLKRKKQLNMGKPPVYDRAALDLSDEEKAKLREGQGRPPYGVELRLVDDEGNVLPEDG